MRGYAPGVPHDEENPARRPAGALEAEILRVLVRASKPLTPRDVLDRLSAPLSYSTVVTILTRMHDKGMAARYRDGRSFRYAPLTDEASMAAGRMSAALTAGTDRASVLRRFVAALQPGDEELLRRLLSEDEARGAE
jgi:predicted transcriptional regulator